MRRRWRLAGSWVWVGISVLAVALVLGLFSFTGPPPGWGTSVVDTPPSFSPESSGKALRTVAADTIPRSHQELLARYDVPGRPRYFDQLGESGEAVLMTSGATWTEDQRLYWRRNANGGWIEIAIPQDFIISNPKLFRSHGKTALLIERWNPWWPYSRSYGRFVQSLTRPELRAEDGIYVLDLERGTPRFLFPGDHLVLSPDRQVAAYVSSEDRGFGQGGFHTIHVWGIETGRGNAVMSLWEIDPGSGHSFDYSWTRDSRALVIRGATSGFGRSAAPPRGTFHALFTLEPPSLYLLDAGR